MTSRMKSHQYICKIYQKSKQSTTIPTSGVIIVEHLIKTFKNIKNTTFCHQKQIRAPEIDNRKSGVNSESLEQITTLNHQHNNMKSIPTYRTHDKICTEKAQYDPLILSGYDKHFFFIYSISIS